MSVTLDPLEIASPPMGGEAISNGSSVTDTAGVKKLVDDTMAAFGRFDV